MTRAFWLLLLASLVATAAPVPKETDREKIEKQFGTIDDPEKDCTFAHDDGKLKITMKGGKQYDWDLDGKVMNCPRLTRQVKGDFVVTAKVYAELPETAEKAGGKWAEAGVGVIVIGEKDRALRAGMHDFRGDKRNLMLVIPNSHGPAGFGVKAAGDGVFVRLKRTGDKLTMGYSTDGKKWQEPLSMGAPKAESYQVGVYAFGNCKDDVTVSISEFSVEQVKEDK